jgi:hypothetical protein
MANGSLFEGLQDFLRGRSLKISVASRRQDLSNDSRSLALFQKFMSWNGNTIMGASWYIHIRKFMKTCLF